MATRTGTIRLAPDAPHTVTAKRASDSTAEAAPATAIATQFPRQATRNA